MGAFDYTTGSTSWRTIFFPSLTCSDANLLDASGLTTTGATGQATFLISQYVCLPLVRAFAAPINIVATARSSSPFYVTATLTLVPDPNNATPSDRCKRIYRGVAFTCQAQGSMQTVIVNGKVNF